MGVWIAVFAAGFAVGFIISMLIFKKKAIGSLKVNYSDPDGPYLFLQLENSPYSLRYKKYVSLKVDISQK